ncbi:MAG TPA: radical SAM protein [Candidatus Eubacterium avistercoris]|uniref:Radical SAM protein n=1 Tax=Candidatus Eubacterium avistercoris TaxID=2838567 RepID=A0A9D2D289_9FIRM|nr:radical SAM protein [Candidatus Eubacterium avistercoris]
MRYEGVVYRPPSEAYSLIVQLTVGCAHNGCTFCTMYKDKTFRIRPVKEILEDFAEGAARYGDRVRRIFLADGDALVMKTEELLEILSFARENFPSLGRISSYGTPGDILRKTKEELTRLRKAGLELIYMGAESGCQQVLRSVNKGASRDEIIAAGKKLKACGMEASVTLISGLGGRKLLKEHAVDSASLISEINPRYVGFLTLMLDEDAPIMEQIKRKELELLEPQEVLEEMRLFLQHVHSEGTIFRSNHASNYIALKGTLDGDIPRMLAQLEEIEKEQRFRPERFRAL